MTVSLTSFIILNYCITLSLVSALGTHVKLLYYTSLVLGYMLYAIAKRLVLYKWTSRKLLILLIIKHFVKFEIYGIKDEALQWFKTYLTQRRQQVCVNNSISDIGQVLYGVPQGSILRPFLFLCFINDLPLYVNNVRTNLYAYDTTLYDILNSVEDIENNLRLLLWTV